MVCLTGREDRVRNVTEMQRIPPQVQIVEAVDGHRLTKIDLQVLQADGLLPETGRLCDNYVHPPDRGRPLKMGELGAFLSHRKAIEIIANGDAPAGVIFEDDVRPCARFCESWSSRSHSPAPTRTSYTSLYSRNRKNSFPLKEHTCTRHRTDSLDSSATSSRKPGQSSRWIV